MTDAEFLKAFESCALPESRWTHEAHVRMAWLYLREKPLAEAIPIVREGIKRYNASLKKNLAYHETITQAFLSLIDHRMSRGVGHTSFSDFREENPDLLDRNMPVLLMHYRKETLFSQAAREAFLNPDIAALPSP